jgi:glycerate kinase
MRVLVAPDSFKGSLTAAEAARAIERGVLRACPRAQVDRCPLSDGGEGFASVLGELLGETEYRVKVTGPLGDPVSATFRLGSDGTALIESASVIGLGLVPAANRQPLKTTTRGVGELLLAALGEGARRIVIGLGGTATTDGGAGMAQALGVRFDGASEDLRGGDLGIVRGVDLRHRDSRLASTRIIALTDVDDALTGPSGAARRYAPQKGASASDVEALEHALEHFAFKVSDPGEAPGDGAAGGLGYGLRIFAGAERRRGIDYVLDAVGFDSRLNDVDLVLTGEGRLDAQSLGGKVVSGVVARCAARGLPVIALAGSIDAQGSAKLEGLQAAYSLVSEGVPEARAIANAAPLLEALAERVMRQGAQPSGT